MAERKFIEMKAGCTIVSPNYLHYARCLAQSYLEHHPDHLFFVLIVADINNKSLFSDERFTPVFLDELSLNNLHAIAMRYDILELNTNVKPTFLKFLLEKYPEIDIISYLDPDIYVYDYFDPVYELLESNDIVLTPHIAAPSLNEKDLEMEHSILLGGTYNLGFVSIRRSSDALTMLNWWELRCLKLAYSESQSGLFVDQKWMSLIPGLFARVAILRDFGCNMAYWNLQERSLATTPNGYMVNGKDKLCFYHFSGINISDSVKISKYSTRFTLENRNDLRGIFAEYRALVATKIDPSKDATPYGFDYFHNGVKVTHLARRIFAAHESRFAHQNPFSQDSDFYLFAKKRRLIGGREYRGETAWSRVNQNSIAIRTVNKMFYATLLLVGSRRYELLMKYLSHFSILRNQKAQIK